jgi:hypothetical protein
MLGNALRGLAAEFGLTVSKGVGQLDELAALVDADKSLPSNARHAIVALRGHHGDLVGGIDALEMKIVAHARHDGMARRLATIPGIGPITASLIAASVVDIGRFRTARQFAAWLGLVPRQSSTGGKTRVWVESPRLVTERSEHCWCWELHPWFTGPQAGTVQWCLAQEDPGAAPDAAGNCCSCEQDGAHRVGGDDARRSLPSKRYYRDRGLRCGMRSTGGMEDTGLRLGCSGSKR